ncbi:MAG TPA: GNAT family N-acetyltransferase [Syntrophorhabdaceae bacterium]|nr:GNAT family N-acetyltransferase [Syntrophorhabdaceae bacterium]HQM82103.1 GNAT family N-acetyltransferase [Syntrophorhabdaceae bacterium]
MKDQGFFKLTIPNHKSYLPVAQAAIREAAKMFGFTAETIYHIELALEEAFMNVIKHAFEAGEDSTFDIICRQTSMGIKIIIKEKGMPFDPGKITLYDPSKDILEVGSTGLGTFLMKEIVDEVSFHNLGSEGKEMHLVKYLPGKNIEGLFDQSELERVEEKGPGPAVIDQRIEYDVRRMKDSEAIEISKGAYKSHGYTFFDEVIYYPEQIVALNNSGEMISAVAATKDDVFMGHAALHYPDSGARIAELTFIFVSPEYRGQGCMKRMLDFLFETPKKYDLEGVYAFAVANHIYSQKTMVGHGLAECGIECATSPATWVFKGISKGESQRISVVLSFKYLQKPKPLTLYPPARHRAMIEKLYKNLGAGHDYAIPSFAEPRFTDDHSVIYTKVYASEGNAEIFIKQYGSNVVREIKRILKNLLCVEQIAAINLYLGMEDPLTHFASPVFEESGFFFSGIMPKTRVGDAIILQFLNNISFNYDKVITYSENAKEILAYIRENDPNVSL